MNKITKATSAENRLVGELTSRPVEERIAAGEAEIVTDDDWSDVPHLASRQTVTIPRPLYRKLKAASRRSHTTPDELATHLLAKELSAR